MFLLLSTDYGKILFTSTAVCEIIMTSSVTYLSVCHMPQSIPKCRANRTFEQIQNHCVSFIVLTSSYCLEFEYKIFTAFFRAKNSAMQIKCMEIHLINKKIVTL